MGVVQEVKDGKFVENNSAASLAEANKKKRTGNDSLDKDAFLQLRGWQRKYQDPLEPPQTRSIFLNLQPSPSWSRCRT